MRTAPLSREALALFARLDATSVSEALRTEGLHADCLNYLPHFLDKRARVWWACLCCFDAYRDGVGGLATPWQRRSLHQPTETNRLACCDGVDIPG